MVCPLYLRIRQISVSFSIIKLILKHGKLFYFINRFYGDFYDCLAGGRVAFYRVRATTDFGGNRMPLSESGSPCPFPPETC